MKTAFAQLLLLSLLVACAVGPQQRINEEKVAEAHADIGIDYMRKGKYDLALKNLHKALRFNNDHANANWALGITYAQLQEPDQAERYYSRAAQLRPTPDILNSYGVFQCRQGQVEQALANFERAAENPRNATPADALANAGYCLAQAQRPADAQTWFRKALADNPKQTTALAGMARLEHARGNYLAARAFLQRLDAAASLDDEALLLGARIEWALNEQAAALDYLHRYNSNNPDATLSLQQLQNQEQ